MKNKNKKVLDSFIAYCTTHPGERFWQALRNWARADFVCFAKKLVEENKWVEIEDTFYFEGKDK